MSGAGRQEVTRRIRASAHAIFEVVADPQGHVRIDGSGMLVASRSDHRLTDVGQTFVMHMDASSVNPSGPGPEYDVLNTVTALVPDRLVEWEPGRVDGSGSWNRWGWILDPVTSDETDVTNFADWSQVSDEWLARGRYPRLPDEILERSLANLARLIEES